MWFSLKTHVCTTKLHGQKHSKKWNKNINSLPSWIHGRKGKKNDQFYLKSNAILYIHLLYICYINWHLF